LSALLVFLAGGVFKGVFALDVTTYTVKLKAAAVFTYDNTAQCPTSGQVDTIIANGTGGPKIFDIEGGAAALTTWFATYADDISCGNNTNAGNAVMKIGIKAAYDNPASANGTDLQVGDSIVTTFAIAKASITGVNQATFLKDVASSLTVDYDGTSKAVTTDLGAAAYTGFGAFTVTYKQNTTSVTAPTNAGSYAVTATMAAGNNFNATAAALEIGTLVIGKKDFVLESGASQTVDTAAVLKAWLDTVKYVSINANGVTVAKNAPNADGIVAKAPLTTAGLLSGVTQTKTYWRLKNAGVIGNVADYDVAMTGAPSDTGHYLLKIDVKGGANINDGTANFPFALEYAAFVSSPIVAPKRVVSYTKSNLYTVDWPFIGNASVFGTLDSIYQFTGCKFLPAADDSWDDDAVDVPASKIKLDKTKRTVSVTLEEAGGTGFNGVGTIRLKFKARGVTAGSEKHVWIYPNALDEYAELDIEVNPKALESEYITVIDYPISYSGDTVTVAELQKKFTVVHEGVLAGKKWEDAASADYVIVPWWNGTGSAEYTGEKNTLNRKDAGVNKAWIVIDGKGNYKGRAIKAFTINRAQLNASVSVTGGSKVYDGKPDIATEGIGPKAVVAFTSVMSAPPASLTDSIASLTAGEDFEFRSAKYSDSTAGVVCSLTARVALRNTDLAQNFSFAGASPDSVTLKAYGLAINKRTLAKSDVIFTIPANHYYNGQQRGIGDVSLKAPLSAGTGASVATVYQYPVGMQKPDYNPSLPVIEGSAVDTAFIPKSAGMYGVFYRILGSPNFEANSKVELTALAGVGDDRVVYEIKPPSGPVIAYPLVTDTRAFSVRQGRSVNLKVSAKSPNAGALTYKWYTAESDGITTVIKPMNIAGLVTTDSVLTISVSGDVGTSASYCAVVTNTAPSGVQDPRAVADTTLAFTVTVDTPPISMVNAKVTVNPEKVWYYTGYPVTPQGADVTVSLPSYVDGADTTWTPIDASHYSLAYVSNVSVGTATVRASAVSTGNYQGTATATFAIARKPFGIVDITFTESRVYTGDTLGAQVKENPPMAGMGAISVRYDTSAAAPVNAGDYDVYVSAAGGDNVSSSGGFQYLGVYTIKQATPVAGASGNLSYADPASLNHTEGGPASSYGIGAVTFKSIKGYTGTIAVLYNGDDEVPVTAGTYTVSLDIGGDDNVESALLTLGVYTIKAGGDAVAESNREIPAASVVTTVSVAPVKAAGSGFTAGPSPVSKNGVIRFFSAKAVKSGSLYIFDANGDAAAKVSAKSGSGEIGSWNLKDKKGAAVAEGSYIVKGALVGKDGTREKVSFVFSVVK